MPAFWEAVRFGCEAVGQLTPRSPRSEVAKVGGKKRMPAGARGARVWMLADEARECQKIRLPELHLRLAPGRRRSEVRNAQERGMVQLFRILRKLGRRAVELPMARGGPSSARRLP